MADLQSFDFLALDYDEILAQELQWLRTNVPELSDESPYAFHVQALRAFALVGHTVNANIDLSFNEALFGTSQLIESNRQQLQMIGYKMRSASPAVAELLAKLTKPFVVSTEDIIIVPDLSQFSTAGTENEDSVIYEIQNDFSISNTTNILTDAFFFKQESTSFGTGFTNSTTPSYFSDSGLSFTSSWVGDVIHITNSDQGKNGFYKIDSLIDSGTVLLVSMGKGNKPAFVDETSLNWERYVYGPSVVSEMSAGTETDALWDTTPIGGDSFYFVHDDVLFDSLKLTISTAGEGTYSYIWEYSGDPLYNAINPNSVKFFGGELYLQATSLLNASNVAGAEVKVTYRPTGASEIIESLYGDAGGLFSTDINYCKVSALGQTSPSINTDDYEISVEWNQLPMTPGVTQTMLNMSSTGTFIYEWTLPESASKRWKKVTINGVNGYAIRIRVVENSPSILTVPIISKTDLTISQQWIKFDVSQGETIEEDPLGSSDGSAGQQFVLAETEVFDGSSILTANDSSDWEEVTDFYSSTAFDNHYRIIHTDDDVRLELGGESGLGRIPTVGVDNLSISYRTGGDLDGNVGADTITQNASGVPFLAEVVNPRPAYGHRFKDGYNDEDLIRLKSVGPASLRYLNGATNAHAIRQAAEDFVSSDGSSPVSRAFAIPGVYGPNTVQLVVMGSGGSHLSDDHIDELEEYFNGSPTSVPPTYGICANNCEVTVSRYRRRLVNITAVIDQGDTAAVENTLGIMLVPTYKDSSGEYLYDAGGEIALSQLLSWIHAASVETRKVTMSIPTDNITFDSDEFPYPGTMSISEA